MADEPTALPALTCPHCRETHFLGSNQLVARDVPQPLLIPMPAAHVYCAGCLTPFTWSDQTHAWREAARVPMKEA
jgi:hypothetical protein